MDRSRPPRPEAPAPSAAGPIARGAGPLPHFFGSKIPRGGRSEGAAGAEPPGGRIAAGDPKPLLTLDTLSVAIEGQTLLHGVSLRLQPGETLALTGESGSGKSLTALAVMGLLPRAATISGTLTFDDTDLDRIAPRRRDLLRGAQMAMVFQEPMTALNPLMTIGAQIAEVFSIHRRPAPDLRALLDRVGLDVPPTRYPHELSGGQRQRVVIAIAIALRPKLLIADEPTTALDVTTQAQILSLLRDLTREDGMALLMITHDLAVVAQMAQRIAVLKDGRLVECAATAEVLSTPRHPYTRELVAASGHRARLPTASVGEVLLRARDVSVAYPGRRRHLLERPLPFTAVQGVSFDLRRGERLGLVGESGCGKSTLTRTLLGLEPRATGRITLDGQAVDPHRPDSAVQRRIQVVFQDPYGSFDPRHRVARLLAEPYHLLGHAPPPGAIDRALAEVGLSPRDARRHIHAFSGGQRQRLAIARALIIRPEVIVLDEAVSALDVRVRAQILDLLAQLSQRHRLTWIFISHDLSVVRQVTDRVLVMCQGKIVEDAPTETLFAAPRHPYTRALLEAAPKLPDNTATAGPRRAPPA
ncbi:ABC transporter ATP-binding protein [Sagittula salina]|uniref:ABC transporter ATP-binding protein n=1 Tax=Sagittula salina TaxID=2820268 RepID=A0A940MPV0_9RHOB|nr:ABC transporter ATP-binding protein [Sagittula salina]MBP0482752.1 ABC transporter ATP-binding protein [Sagittula salina]